MNKRDLYYFNEAADAAKLSTYGRNVTIGCIVVYKKKMISWGFNQDKTDTIQMRYNKYRNFEDNNYVEHKIHAEVHALKHIERYIISKRFIPKYISLYVVRVSNNEFSMARPCIACLNYIKHLGIKNIYYSTNDGFMYEKLD